MATTPQLAQGLQVAANLIKLTKSYKSSDPVQATGFRQAFKEQSKNDLTRILVYLLEVVGSNDVANKYLEGENKDLRELLKIHNIDPDKEVEDDPKTSESAGVVNEAGSEQTDHGTSAKEVSQSTSEVTG